MAEGTNKIYPFKFLNAYESNDAEIFFGRDEEIKTLYEMVSQNPVVVVYGASGTGKTSLIQCGLAGKFRSYDWLPITVRRNGNINKALIEALDKAGGNTIHFDAEIDGAAEEALTELARKVKNVYLSNFKPIYLIFDQFEELYTLGNREEEDIFISSIKEILTLNKPVKIIFSVREEYLGYLYRFEKALPSLLRKKLRVEPMTQDDLDEILKGINKRNNLLVRFEKNIGEISDAISEKFKGEKPTLTIELPYLQVFFENLYQQKTNDKNHETETTISLEMVKDMGNIGDVLKKFLEEQAEEIGKLFFSDNGHAINDAAATIWKVLSPFATQEGTKYPLKREEVETRIFDPSVSSKMVDQYIEEFVKRRILNNNEETGRYELAHDALALCIAGKRSPEENKLMEVARLIHYQAAVKEGVNELFTEKQMKAITPLLPKLKLSKDEEKLLENSRQQIKINIAKRRRIRYSVIAGTFLLLALFGSFYYRTKAEAEKEVVKDKWKGLIMRIRECNDRGNYLQKYLYTVEALCLQKDQGKYDSLVNAFFPKKEPWFYRYTLENIIKDTLPFMQAQFGSNDQTFYTWQPYTATGSAGKSKDSPERAQIRTWQTGAAYSEPVVKQTAIGEIPYFKTDPAAFKLFIFEKLEIDEKTGLPLFLTSNHIQNIYGVIYSKDSSLVITLGRNKETLYDAIDFWTADGINARIPALVHDGVEGACLNADGSRVITWGGGSTLMIWKKEEKESERALFKLPPELMKMKCQVETGVRVLEIDHSTIQPIPYAEYILLRDKFLVLYNEYLEKKGKRNQ